LAIFQFPKQVDCPSSRAFPRRGLAKKAIKTIFLSHSLDEIATKSWDGVAFTFIVVAPFARYQDSCENFTCPNKILKQSATLGHRCGKEIYGP